MRDHISNMHMDVKVIEVTDFQSEGYIYNPPVNIVQQKKLTGEPNLGPFVLSYTRSDFLSRIRSRRHDLLSTEPVGATKK